MSERRALALVLVFGLVLLAGEPLAGIVLLWVTAVAAAGVWLRRGDPRP